MHLVTRHASLVFALIVFAGYLHAQAPAVAPKGLPGEVSSCVKSLGPQYSLGQKAKPLYLRGAFTKAGKREYAVLIQRNRQQGIAFCETGVAQTHPLIGAGSFFHGMKDLNFDTWNLYPKRKPVEQGVGVGDPPVLHHDALLLEWSESASAIVYWNGRKFVWYQQGD